MRWEMIINLFKRKPKLTGRQINMWEHKGWGNSIYFLDYKLGKVSGHMFDKPKVGDILNSKMESGEVGQFLVMSVEYMRDPHDMFFANVTYYGYRESDNQVN